MLNLYQIHAKALARKEFLTFPERFSLLYHDQFDYPLTINELIKWTPSPLKINKDFDISTVRKNGYFYLDVREGLVYKRLLRKRISLKKFQIAAKAAKFLKFIPGIRFAGITGSLAMENSSDDSDIDLMLITKKGTLWLTRLVVIILLQLLVIPSRRSDEREAKDKLCLNLWLDESDLIWKKIDRNFYTAHEIAQVVPLVNKDKTYESFLSQNKWILDYWPNSVRISSKQQVVGRMQNQKSLLLSTFYVLLLVVEKLAFKLQYNHMRSKITREVVTPTRALFHPQDWGKVVMERLEFNSR